MEVSTGSARRQKRFKRTVCAAYVAVAALCVVFVALATAFPRHAKRRTHKLDYKFCCPELSEPLWYIMNGTVPACESLFDHVCYKWKRNDASRTVRFTFIDLLDYWLSILNVTDTKVGYVLQQLHTSCVKTMSAVISSSTQKPLVHALVEELRLVPPVRVSDVLRIIVLLSYKYNILKLIKIIYLADKNPRLVVASGNARLNNRFDVEYAGALFLDDANKGLGGNVTIEDIGHLLRDMPRRDVEEPETSGNLSILEDLFPNPPGVTFLELFQGVYPLPVDMAVKVYAFHEVQERLRFLTSPQAYPVSIAFLILDTAMHLYKLTSQLLVNFTPSSRNKICANHLKEYRILIFALMTEKLTDPDKDKVVEAVVAKVQGAIAQYVTGIFGKTDSAVLGNTVMKMKPALPSEIFGRLEYMSLSPSELYVNILRYYEWLWKLSIGHSGDTLSPIQATRRRVSETLVEVLDGTIFVPPINYVLLKSVRDEALFGNIAALGADIADALWRVVFDLMASSSEYKQRWRNLSWCGLRGRGGLLQYSILSLQTAAWAAMDDGWYQSIDVWPLWEASKSRVFYMLYVYLHACLPVISQTFTETIGRMEVRFVERVADFQITFRCPRTGNDLCMELIPARP